jgi:ABC-type multidrug transport system fused ATPase/permease subunit
MSEQEATKFDENVTNTISSIEKLLSMAEKSEEKISKHKKDELFLFLAGYLTIFAFVLILFVIPWYRFSSYLGIFVGIVLILFAVIIYFFTVKIFEVTKNKKKEVITFNESLGVVQESLPYYFDKMSVLEKTIYKIRLSKLDIVVTEVKQKNNNSSIRTEVIKALISKNL